MIGDCPNCESGTLDPSGRCRTCAWQQRNQPKTFTETWHFDETRGACVPRDVPHACPSKTCPFYAQPSQDDPALSVAELRAIARATIARIGTLPRPSLADRRAQLRLQAAKLAEEIPQ